MEGPKNFLSFASKGFVNYFCYLYLVIVMAIKRKLHMSGLTYQPKQTLFKTEFQKLNSTLSISANY